MSTWYCGVCYVDYEGDVMGHRDEDGRAVCMKCQAEGRKTWGDAL
jgi:hypothetical protein